MSNTLNTPDYFSQLFAQLNSGNLLPLSGSFIHHVQKKKIITSSVEPLVLSCCRYRLRNSEGGVNVHFDTTFLANNITQEDHDMAHKIVEHYSKKIILWQLANSEISKFRKDLAEFISNYPQLTLKDEFCGMIYKLPEFYNYDCELEVLKETYFSGGISLPRKSKQHVCKIIPVHKMQRNMRGAKSIEFWFKMQDEGDPVLITVPKNNVLLEVFTKLFDLHKPFFVKGNISIGHIEKFQYWRLDKWKLQENLAIC